MASSDARITFTCPHCAKVLRTEARPPEGRQVKCPACETGFIPELPPDDEVIGFQEKPRLRAESPKSAAADERKSRPDDDDRPRRKKSRDDDEDDDDRPRRKKSRNADDEEDEDRRPRSKRRRDDDDEDDDDRPPRKRKDKTQSSNTMLFVLLFLGLGVGLLSCAGCGIGIYFIASAPESRAYTIHNLAPGRSDTRSFTFTQGKRVTVNMASNTTMPRTDVDLYVLRRNAGEDIIAFDVTIGPNGNVSFVAPETGTYRVRVVNLGPGMARTSTVNITEQ